MKGMIKMSERKCTEHLIYLGRKIAQEYEPLIGKLSGEWIDEEQGQEPLYQVSFHLGYLREDNVFEHESTLPIDYGKLGNDIEFLDVASESIFDLIINGKISDNWSEYQKEYFTSEEQGLQFMEKVLHVLKSFRTVQEKTSSSDLCKGEYICNFLDYTENSDRVLSVYDLRDMNDIAKEMIIEECEFSIDKNARSEHNGEPCWRLIDEQEAYLGDIGEEEFSVGDYDSIIERLSSTYFLDYGIILLDTLVESYIDNDIEFFFYGKELENAIESRMKELGYKKPKLILN